jgi:lipoyl-dependent peroxiredoxin
VSKIAKVLYSAKTHTTGDRKNGIARKSDGRLDIRLSTPGSARIGTNPEQLFAAGWSTSSMKTKVDSTGFLRAASSN